MVSIIDSINYLDTDNCTHNKHLQLIFNFLFFIIFFLVDSPEAKVNPDEEGYFDEIRSFMGKVTATSTTSGLYSPSHHSDADIDVEEDDLAMDP